MNTWNGTRMCGMNWTEQHYFAYYMTETETELYAEINEHFVLWEEKKPEFNGYKKKRNKIARKKICAALIFSANDLANVFRLQNLITQRFIYWNIRKRWRLFCQFCDAYAWMRAGFDRFMSWTLASLQKCCAQQPRTKWTAFSNRKLSGQFVVSVLAETFALNRFLMGCSRWPLVYEAKDHFDLSANWRTHAYPSSIRYP